MTTPSLRRCLRTAKYRPEFPIKGFADLTAAREWSARFGEWQDHQHRHSGIRHVTPTHRHAGEHSPVSLACLRVLPGARHRTRNAGAGRTRNWSTGCVVTLNSGSATTVVRAATSHIRFSGSVIGEPAVLLTVAAPVPRRATQEMRGSGATQSHAQRALLGVSMARLRDPGFSAVRVL